MEEKKEERGEREGEQEKSRGKARKKRVPQERVRIGRARAAE